MRMHLAAQALAVLAVAAHAQDMGSRGGQGRGLPQSDKQKKAGQQKKKVVDDAYASTFGRIPDSKEKYDPCRSVH